MKIGFVCQFDEQTAEHILTTGRHKAALSLGHDSIMITQLFKGVGPRLLLKNLLANCVKLRKCDKVFIQKALPLGVMYAIILTFISKAEVVGIVDDWEGQGGFVSIRNRGKIKNIAIVSICEELFIRFCNRVWCVSRLLYDRWDFTKCRYIPNGGEEPLPFKPRPDNNVIGYLGTLKSHYLKLALEGYASDIMAAGMTFNIIGGNPSANYIKDAVNIGFVEKSKLKTYLERITFGIVYLNDSGIESLIDQSRSSTKLFEYWQYGIIPIVSPVGECANLVGDGYNGIYLDKNNDWLKTVKYISAKPDTLSALRHNGYNTLKKYTHSEILKGWLS